MKIFTLIIFALTTFNSQSQPAATRIDSFMTALYNRGQFTGAVLVAEKGTVIYKKSFGYADRENKIPFRPSTQEYIGSISKQFTAMGIMMLEEKGKLKYDQPIRDFFPELPECTKPVTIRHLLYHVSGLAIFDDYPDMTEKNVFDELMKQKTLRFIPGEKFEYCNSGYSLLGMLIEKISGQTLNDFMQENIFRPVGMNSTYVSTAGKSNSKRAIGYTVYGAVNSYDTYMGGNAAIISTVEDLYKWDQELYHCRLVKPVTLNLAFRQSASLLNNPALLLKDDLFGDKSYGFGWWIASPGESPDLFHDGAFSGYLSYMERITSSKITLINLSNLRHPYVLDIRKGIMNILAGKSPALPKIPGSVFLYRESLNTNMDTAISRYKLLQNNNDSGFEFSERNLNSFGYVLLNQNLVDNAIKIFELNVEFHPNSFNVYDSLADGFLKKEDKAKALACCRKALEIDPANEDMKKRIQALEKGGN